MSSFGHLFDIRISKHAPKLWLLVRFDLKMRFAPLRRATFRHLNFKKWSGAGVLCTFWVANVLLATAACNFLTSQLQKVVWSWCALYILTCKCASRHCGVQFFGIWTSKSGPELVCFVHFDLQMCFSLQQCAIFPHPNFKKWSGAGALCTFWLANVLLATVQFFHIPTSKKGPNMVCFLHVDLQMCFSLQRRAIFHFSSERMTPHPPL